MKFVFTIVGVLLFNLSFGQLQQKVGDFHRLKVSKNLSVNIIASNENRLETDEATADKVSFVNRNGQLRLRTTMEDFLKGEEAGITLYYKSMDEIFADAGGAVYADQPVKGTNLKLKANKGSVIQVPLEVKNLEVTLNSSGKISARGTAGVQNVTANSGGEYDGRSLNTSYTKVSANAGGTATVNASDKVDATTRAGGTIDIFGGAEVNQQSIAGGEINVH